MTSRKFFATLIAGFIFLAAGSFLAACQPQAAPGAPTPAKDTSPGDEAEAYSVLIPAGEFLSGNPRWISGFTPGKTTSLEAFHIDRSEVTNRQYAACVSAGACLPPANTAYFEQPAYADHPVLYVTRSMAQAYCEWRQARLPTALEWEKAAIHTPARSQYPLDEKLPVCQAAATPGENYTPGANWEAPNTTAVGSANQNQYGLYDVAGNTLEWVQAENTGEADESVTYLRTIRYSGYGELFGRYYCSFRCAQMP